MSADKVTVEETVEDAGGGAGVEVEEAAARLAELVSAEAVDRLVADAEASGTPLDGPDGLLIQMTKAVIEPVLGVELADHLGYERGDPAGAGSGNSAMAFRRRR